MTLEINTKYIIILNYKQPRQCDGDCAHLIKDGRRVAGSVCQEKITECQRLEGQVKELKTQVALLRTGVTGVSVVVAV